MKIRLAALAFAAASAAPAAQACSPMVPTPIPGQSLEDAVREMYAAADRKLWARAPMIYRARVVSVAQAGRWGERFEFAAVAPIKGGPPPQRVAWTPQGAACESYAGRVGDTVTLFARRRAWEEGAARWGAWAVMDAWSADKPVPPP